MIGEIVDDKELGKGKTCFIISPIGNKLEPVGTPGRVRYEESVILWEEVLLPACAVFGISPVRSDKISETGEIPDQIFRYLRDADIVIADLSHANPNVMYELGLRHSLQGNVTIQIGEHGFLPFDVTTIRTIQFARTQAGMIAVRDELIETIRSALQGKGTPVRATEVLTSSNAITPDAVEEDVRRSAEVEEELLGDEEAGIIDLLAEGEEATTHMSMVLDGAGEWMAAIGELVKSFGEQVTESDSKGKGFAGRLLLARQLAENLTDPVKTLEESSNEFSSDVQSMDAMVTYVIDRVRSGEEDPSEVATFFSSLKGLIDAADDASVGVIGFREGAKKMRTVSRALAPSTNTLVNTANKFLEGINLMVSWRNDITEILAGIEV